MKDYSRTDRIAELIQRELAFLIQQEVKDPRLGMVTVSDVSVTRDLAYAKVYVTVFGEPTTVKKSLTVLNHAASYLRTMLGKRIKIRKVPELIFVYDKSVTEGKRLADLINKVSSDENSDPDNT
jgi:ribosome-binding factor A